MAARRSAANYAPPEHSVRGDSQTSDSPDIRLLMEKMLEDSKKRKETKRQALQNDHSRRVQKFSNDIQAAFAEYEKKRQKEQKQQISRLIELLKKREMIERRIMKSVNKLEIQYNAHLRVLQSVTSKKATDLID